MVFIKFTIIGHWGGYPAPNGATTAYILEKDDFVLAIDMGSGALSKIQNYYHFMDLDAVILSHYHHDHVADVGVLQYARLVQSYVTGEEKVLPIYGHMEDEAGFESLTHDFTKGIVYRPDEELAIGPFTITFLRTIHPVPCYGMRITDGDSVIVYTADTAYHEQWIDFAKNAHMMITDCNFYADQDAAKAGHMTSKEGAIIASKANVKDLILSHLPQFGNHSHLVSEAKIYFNGKVHLAHEGFTWERNR